MEWMDSLIPVAFNTSFQNSKFLINYSLYRSQQQITCLNLSLPSQSTISVTPDFLKSLFTPSFTFSNILSCITTVQNNLRSGR